MSSAAPISPFLPIYERYIDEASFLWVLLGVAQTQPHYEPEDIAELELRITRQIDGLMTAPNEAWPLCLQALALEEPGEIFTAAVVAFRCGDLDKIQAVVETATVKNDTLMALASALNWVSGPMCHPWIIKFFSSKDFSHKRLALEVCRLRNENPADYLRVILERDDCRADIALYGTALKVMGDFKRHDLVSHLNDALGHDDPVIKFYAVRSLILLGDRQVLALLKPYVMQPSDQRSEAIDIAFRVLPIAEARSWIGELAGENPASREVIKAATVLGDPHVVGWLTGQMREIANARLAGESFSTITGIDLTQHHLVNELPDLEEQLESLDDDFVGLDEDENLPFPAAEKVAAVWQKYGQHFQAGQRYFLGKVIADMTLLEQHWLTGSMRHRRMAAYERALKQPNIPLLSVRSKLP